MNEIKQTLTCSFEKHRIILWYDEKRELHEEYEALALPDVEKITLGNNQFGIKHHILRQGQESQYNFLINHTYPLPDAN